MIAFVYAGQGSQKVGMGRDLYEAYPAFRAVFDSAPVDFDLKSLCFEGPEERLNRTRYTQPCLLACHRKPLLKPCPSGAGPWRRPLEISPAA